MNVQTQFIHIVHLVDSPEAAATLAKWFEEEWEPWYGSNGQGNAERDLAECCTKNNLPVCLIALDQAGDVLGTAALKTDSVGSETGVGPWLAALIVGKEHRGKGVGSALVAAIEGEAHRLGIESIFTSVNTAERIMMRRGWQIFGAAESLRGATTVYRKHIQDQGS